ncbi:MAG: AAA family ATPase [Lachnospiraceae bacterium]|nr:AAA family ATPase [Lachnospiraceae bacterium]
MMEKETAGVTADMSRQAEESYLEKVLGIVRSNVENYGGEVARMKEDIDEMLDHFHDDNPEVINLLENTITLHDHMARALERNEKAMKKPYFGRIVFRDETLGREESFYIGRGGISEDATHLVVVDWRAPVANTYYENGLGKCSYAAPDGTEMPIDLKLKRTYEIEDGRLLDYFDSEVIANDDLLTKYLAKNKQAVLGEIIATIQKEQNDIIRRSPYHNIIVQGVAGSGKTTVAMHRISFILYNYPDRFRPDDFYIVGSNRILLEYITGVLPDLDVYGIRQMTMEQLFIRLLYEDWDEKKYRILSADKMDKSGNIKGTLSWYRDLEEYCRRVEWEVIPRETVYLDRRQFVEGFQDGKTGVFDRRGGEEAAPGDLIEIVPGEAVERYIRQNPTVSVQSKIDMLNERLIIKLKDEFLGKGVKYTESERKAILRAYRGRYGAKVWKRSIFDLYREFLTAQREKGFAVNLPKTEFDVYDLAALAYIYKRIKETEVISEAHHVVIDEAQDFGMMAYSVLKYCIRDCTYTVMGDVSQNIHFGYGLNDWEELRRLLLPDAMDSFGVLKKSYRNTVEISKFATDILHHGRFYGYPVEPIIRHGEQVSVQERRSRKELIRSAASVCRRWQEKGLDTIAVVCRSRESAAAAAKELGEHIEVMENDLEKAVFGSGIMVLPVEYTKGLEFDAVLILDPDRKEYPVDDGHAKLLYVAATRALHELCVLHMGNLTGLIADPLPEPDSHSGVEEKDRTGMAGKYPDGAAGGMAGDGAGKPVMGRKLSIVQNKRFVESEPEGQRRARREEKRREEPLQKVQENQGQPALPKKPQTTADRAFGDMPATETLRPPGHGKIDLAVKWVMKQADGLYLQSRYGILRLSPVGSAIIRVTFSREQQIAAICKPQIAARRVERAWMYREAGGAVEMVTDELCLRVDKATGAISYLTRDKKVLLEERRREPRQIEKGIGGNRLWMYMDWKKEEKIYGIGAGGQGVLNLRGTARYISQEGGAEELPFILSDRGYGILLAAEGAAVCCDIPAYGSYLYTENEAQMDFYFIAGKTQNTIMDAHRYLCGRL